MFDRRWAGLKNGELLSRASLHYGVFLTADQNLRYQQNLAGHHIGVVVLAAVSNRVDDLIALVPDAVAACLIVKPGEVKVVRTPAT